MNSYIPDIIDNQLMPLMFNPQKLAKQTHLPPLHHEAVSHNASAKIQTFFEIATTKIEKNNT